ncbi:hypothetical protein NDA16_001003 [Ustilago loliicola]|nr:hypothetical protein NDA16_001003 [Ustilago loliicola]
MSAPAFETATLAPGSQAEASSSAQADSALRRGSRARKPTLKAAGLDPIETTNEASAASRAGKKRKADDLNAEQEVATVADRINEVVDEVFDGADEEEEDENEYCLCRGKDDGTFMISCERCNEWYHTKCIGISQKAAKKLEEYICEACLKQEPKTKTSTTSKSVKATKQYKSSRKRQASQAASDGQEDMEQDEDNDDDDVSDGDEYVGERNVASDAEDVAMEDDLTVALSARSQGPKQSEAGTSTGSQSTSQAKAKSTSSADTSKEPLRKASKSLRRPSASNKPTSGPKKGSPRKASGPTDASTEEARSRAHKVLAAALEKIFSSGHDANQKKQDTGKSKESKDEDQEEEEVETDQQRAEAYAALLEEELFETNADLHGSIRAVGAKYKDRFRTFLFSLKDAKNTTLHSRIASGELKASELAKMSNEELANDAIRQATEKARLEALHRSTLRAEEAGPMRKITHKGEIEIESDAFAREQLGKFQKSGSTRDLASEKPPAVRVSDSEPAVSASVADREDDMSDSEARSPARRSAPAPTQSQGSPAGLNFGDVWNQSTETKTQDEDAGPQESYGFDVGSPHEEIYHHDTTAAGDGAVDSGVDDLIDSFLDGPSGEDNTQTGHAAQPTSSAQPDRSTTPDVDPPSSAVHRYRIVLWNGLIDLPDVFAFQGHVKQVAGRSLATAPRVWPKFLPERPLLIAGRLPSKAAIDYLLQVVNAPKTEILAFTMDPGTSKDGVAQVTDSDVASFEGMIKHFKNADRWGALHISSSVKGSLIKDFYVVPLYKDEEVPLWLDMAESDCLGADWHTKRDRDLLVLVAVVIKDALQAELSKADRLPARQRSTTNEAPRQRQESGHLAVAAEGESDDVYDPTAGISIPLGGAGTSMPAAAASGAPAIPSGFGTNALQNLLRTLGKTAAPATSLSTPTPTVGAAASGALSPLGVPPPGPLPPGPPPRPPPSFGGLAPPAPQMLPASASPISGSWSPRPPPTSGAEGTTPPQHWQPQQAYAPPPYEYGGAPADPAAYGGGWGYEVGWNPASDAGMYPPPSAGPERSPPQPQELPEEEYPGQYNPDFLAQASAGGARGDWGRGHGHGRGGGRGRGGRGRGRGW